MSLFDVLMFYRNVNKQGNKELYVFCFKQRVQKIIIQERHHKNQPQGAGNMKIE